MNRGLLIGVFLIIMYLAVGFVFLSIGLDKCPDAEARYNQSKTECDTDFLCEWWLATAFWFGLGWLVVLVFYIMLEGAI